MSELLLELFSEEIPARLQPSAERDLKRLFMDFCRNTSLGCDDVKTFSTPRRIGLVALGLPLSIAASKSITKGPRLGAPEAALEGFCRKMGVDMTSLSQNDGFYWAEVFQLEQSTLPLLKDGLTAIIKTFPWAKTMRSGTTDFRWIRPLRSILCLFDHKVVPIEINGLTAGSNSFGHRFLSDGKPIEVTSFSDYEAKLKSAFVLINRDDRKTAIIEKSKTLCAQNELILIEDDELLEEVVGLVEWPYPLIGPMNPQFLSLPPEVIRTSMRAHQKYFALKSYNTDGLSPHFLLISHMEPKDGGAEIIRGNAKVLSARLSDAQFFYHEDQKIGNFDRWRQSLMGVTHHAKLGSLKMRSTRIENLAVGLAPFFGVEPSQAQFTSSLLKADLASAMVGEFPELQGLMGGDYAIKSGMDQEIGDAIAEHYRPHGPQDNLPRTRLGALMALCDKLDTLFGFFAIDEKPTGSKDPFALRRSALGVLRILRQFGIETDMKSMLSIWYQGLIHYAGPGQCVFIDTKEFDGSAGPRWNHGGNDTYQNYLRDFRKGLEESEVKILATDREYDLELRFEIVDRPGKPQTALYQFRAMTTVLAEFEEFLNTRLKVMIKDYGLNWEHGETEIRQFVTEGIVEAVGNSHDLSLHQRINRIEVLNSLTGSEEWENILSGFKRANNILESAKYAQPTIKPKLDNYADHRLDVAEESLFFQDIQALINDWQQDEALSSWRQNLRGYSLLKTHLDGFLNTVLIMDEDINIRARRLDLLAIYRDLGLKLADWTKLFG
jgi:glycyl-tRNA synthetase beta chain